MRFTSAMLALAFLAACDPANSPAARQTGDHVTAAAEAQEATFAARDAAAAAATYAPDAVFAMAGQPTVTTNEGMVAVFQQLFADPTITLTSETQPPIMPSSGDYGTVFGTYTITRTDPATQQQTVVETGSFMQLWRKQDDDSWKVMREIVAPGPAAATAP